MTTTTKTTRQLSTHTHGKKKNMYEAFVPENGNGGIRANDTTTQAGCANVSLDAE